MAAEIQLLACGYSARCSVRGCGARATMVARYSDGQGRPLRQRELYERHDWLKANRPSVHDLRDPRCLRERSSAGCKIVTLSA